MQRQFEYLDKKGNTVTVTPQELRALAEAGELDPKSSVRFKGSSDWHFAHAVKGLTFPSKATDRATATHTRQLNDDSERFEFLDDDGVVRPTTAGILKKLSQKGAILANTPVRVAGEESWSSASQFEGLVFTKPTSGSGMPIKPATSTKQDSIDDFLETVEAEPENAQPPDPHEQLAAAMSAPLPTERVARYSSSPQRWQSKNKGKWRSLAWGATVLAGLHWIVACIAIAIGGLVAMFAIFAATNGDLPYDVRRAAETNVFVGISIAASAVPTMCLAVVLWAIGLFALDRSE